MEKIIQQVIDWHYARNLIHGSTDLAQFAKLAEEMGELSANISRGKDIRDPIADMLVVLINIAERNKLTLQECLEVGWNEIKNRKGEMRNGIFIKEEDL